MIRQGRLEWRAEVTSAELARIKPGLAVTVTAATGAAIQGRVRMVAPTVDPQTRAALVYVDLPSGSAARAGRAAGTMSAAPYRPTKGSSSSGSSMLRRA